MSTPEKSVAAQDADSKKLDSLDDMFEDLSGGQQETTSTDGADVTANPEWVATDVNDGQWWEVTDGWKDPYAKALEEAANTPWDDTSWDDWTADASASAGDWNPTDDLQSFIDELEAIGDSNTAAQANLGTAIDSWDQDEIKKAYDALVISDQENKRAIKNLTTQLETERGNSDRILQDKFILEWDLREKSVIADIVEADDSLKSLIAFKSKKDSSEAYNAKYINLLKEMYEAATGESIDGLKNDAIKAEKSMMGGNDYVFSWNSKAKSPDDMFEDIA